ncbi:unnamed protein product [Rotaria sp. Silwood2]|nr:unnamed protein product [Rotaria sp. Silwood2]
MINQLKSASKRHSDSISLTLASNCATVTRYQLLTDGHVQIYRIPRAKNIIEKIRFSRFFHRWEDHHICLEQSEITSSTVNTLDFRDQLFYSVQWKLNKSKFERILRSTDNQEVLLKEITNMINFVMTTPIEDVEVHHFPLEIIFEILQQEFNLVHVFRANVIETLEPLLEKNYPSPEMCNFFSRHCRDDSRSQIVIQMFTRAIEKILKHNTDFSKYPRLRTLVQEYILALNSQNDGLHVVQEFIKRLHGSTMVCPFLRVLSNLISVCLSAVYNVFQGRKNLCFENTESYRAYEEETKIQVVCYTKILQTIIFKNVLKNLVEDTRCEVHQKVLGIREGKDGWFEMCCLSGIACDDNGKMFSLMLSKLLSCCCRKRSFLLRINKLLPALKLLALRESQSSLDTLCAMLEFDAVENHDTELQLISTLQSTPTGFTMYAEVCRRKIALRTFQQKGGPRELELPTYSTDVDLAILLSRGPFGNLECLSLASTYITSACAKHLIKLPALKDLNLSSTQFGDDGLELISEHLNQLKVLNLSETPVTNKGLACLARKIMIFVFFHVLFDVGLNIKA